MAVVVELALADVQDVDADALLVPVDGALCRLGGATSMAMTVIGTAYRMPGDVAVRAQVDGLAATSADVRVVWAFRDLALVEIARAAALRVGLRVG